MFQFTCKINDSFKLNSKMTNQHFTFFQPYSRYNCPWLIKWLLGYEDFGEDKDKENTDNKIKEYLQGMKTNG